MGDRRGRPAPSDVALSRHCVARFRERCCPALSREQAARQLRELANAGYVVPRCPQWIRARGYLVTLGFLVIEDVAPRLALPVVVSKHDPIVPLATTCLVEGCE